MDVVKHSSLLILVSSSIFFLNLGGAKLWDEDEPRNAGCAVEMMTRGDWVVPWFNGQIRTHKPVLLYWFMISAYEAFGVTEFAARFWSAALAVGTVLMTASLGVRLLGRGVGMLGGIALSSMLMFVVASRAATPDSVLIFFMTASLAVYVWATPAFGKPLRLISGGNEPSAGSGDANQAFPTGWAATALMYGLMGMAALAKGPIGFLVPCAIIGMFLLIHQASPKDVERHSWFAKILAVIHPIHFLKTCLSMRLGILIASVLAVALPWYIWVTVRSDGAWTRGFFFEHNLGRAVNAMENHGGGPFYYVTAFLIGTFPWSIFFLPALLDVIAAIRDRSEETDEARGRRVALTFLCCWVGVIIVLFSLASTKLPSYISPCHPAAALLFAHYLVRLAEKRSSVANYWPYASFAVLALVGVAISIVIPTLAVEFVPNAAPLLLVGVLLVLGACAATWAWKLGETQWTVRCTSVTACLFVIMMFGWGAPRVSDHQQIDRLAEAIHTQHPTARFAHSGVFRSSWVFYLGAPLTPIDSGDADQTLEFLDRGDDHYVIATDESYQKLMAQRPHEFEVVDEIPFFLEPDESLHLLQRANLDRIAAKPESLDRDR
ncbi:MAG: glycosyltransferase family 39 protein [Planctomycetota bacterium]